MNRCGVRATKVNVVLPGERQEGPAELMDAQSHHDASHPHHHGKRDHAHEHHGPHRHVGELHPVIERAPLSPLGPRARGARVPAPGRGRGPGPRHARRRGGPARGRCGGRAGRHRRGDRGIRAAGHRAGFTTVRWRSGQGGCGPRTGSLPVPAPATAILLEGVEVAPNGPVTGEATTPTGAVLLRVLSEGAAPGAMARGRRRRVGRRRPEPARRTPTRFV